MVLQEYLQENMYINNEIACAYLKIGPKASELMTRKNVKVLSEKKKRYSQFIKYIIEYKF